MTIFTIEKLYKAYKDCLKHKKNTINALKFELNREKNLINLLKDLETRKYKISRHICFVVTEPTPREIFAADFRDRIVHHLLYNEIKDLFESNFIDESYANRTGKGTHKAVKSLKYNMVRGGINGERLYFLKMDIKGFFRSINKDILFDLVKKGVLNSKKLEQEKREIIWLVEKIIYNDPTKNYCFKGNVNLKKVVPSSKSLFFGEKQKGLPIGNLTSQFFANVYLNELDHFVKEELCFCRYLRYVDDFIILDEDYNKLEKAEKTIEGFLFEKLKLLISKDKVFIKPVSSGIDFLGYFIKPTHTLVRRKVVRRFKRKMYDNMDREDGFYPIEFSSVIISYFGHFKYANSYNLIQKIKEF